MFGVCIANMGQLVFHSDTLEVYVQAGCDAPWERVYKKFNPQLQTAPNTTFDFKPIPSTMEKRFYSFRCIIKVKTLIVKFVWKMRL